MRIRQAMLRKMALAVMMVSAMVSCSRPDSYEPFIVREKAEYGDTYSFELNCSDLSSSYSLDFYTRLEREPFGDFPSEPMNLDLRFISPDGTAYSDTVAFDLGTLSDSSYYAHDYYLPYTNKLDVNTPGYWRLKVKAINQPEEMLGLGIVLKRRDGTR